jgi:ABC-type Fe3+ transport system substrate-binding protein
MEAAPARLRGSRARSASRGAPPHPHAALLFADFILSKEGQAIIKARDRVPSSRAVDSPLNKFDYALVDPVIVLDEWAQWEQRWSACSSRVRRSGARSD